MVYETPTITASTLLTAKLFNYLETQYDNMKDVYDNSNHSDRYYTQDECNEKFYRVIEGLVSSADADMLDGHHVADIIGNAFPIGSILYFHGIYEDIPNGWYVCDGTHDTLDLRDRMIVGRGSLYTLGAAYGAFTALPTADLTVDSHILTTEECPQHEHTFTEKSNSANLNKAAIQNDGYYVRETGYTEEKTTSSTGGNTGHNHENSSIVFDSINIVPQCKGLYIIKRLG